MKITILTLFPEMFVGPFSESIIKRAQEKGSVAINIVNIRDFGLGSHKVVDDKPYGGGVGMVMRVDVIDQAIQFAKKIPLHPAYAQTMASKQGYTGQANKSEKTKVILLDPRGKQFKQTMARSFSQLDHLILLCAHYEGVDERVRNLVDETISIGDFVVTGGEIPAMLITDAVVRLVSGVLKDDATQHESFEPHPGLSKGEENHEKVFLLECPQYTTPQDYDGEKVPDVLLSGNHAVIEKWRQEKAIELTKIHRPDLLKQP